MRLIAYSSAVCYNDSIYEQMHALYDTVDEKLYMNFKMMIVVETYRGATEKEQCIS